MKKISLLKRLSFSAAAVAAITPITLTLSSCSKANAIETKYVSFEDLYASESSNVLKSGYFSKEKLLLGTNKFFDGNYILFVGSNCFDSTRKFFSSDEDTNRDVNVWFNEHLHESIWYRDVVSANLIKTKGGKDFEVKFGFATYVDNYSFVLYDDKGHEIRLASSEQSGWQQIIGPFDVWSKEQIIWTKKQTKQDLNYDWDDESVEEGDYIRQDKQAKAYRELCKKGAAMFPVIEKARDKTFDITDGNNTSLMAIYKNGELQNIVSLPQNIKENPGESLDDKDTATLFGTINKYFTEEEEEESK